MMTLAGSRCQYDRTGDQWSENFQQVFDAVCTAMISVTNSSGAAFNALSCAPGSVLPGALLNANHVARGYCGIALQP